MTFIGASAADCGVFCVLCGIVETSSRTDRTSPPMLRGWA
jgi:hypothetical protein